MSSDEWYDAYKSLVKLARVLKLRGQGAEALEALELLNWELLATIPDGEEREAFERDLQEIMQAATNQIVELIDLYEAHHKDD